MIENKQIYINIGIGAVNSYAKDYEVVAVYTDNYTSVEYWAKEEVSHQMSSIKLPIPVSRATTMALMKLKRTQEILYGETK